VGAVLTAPLAVASGQWIAPHLSLGRPDKALILASMVHVLTYSGYVWLVGRTGSVFAAQVSYPVTVFGIGWAMLILSESYSGWFWAALALIIVGVFMVQPRPGRAALDAAAALGDNGR